MLFVGVVHFCGAQTFFLCADRFSTTIGRYACVIYFVLAVCTDAIGVAFTNSHIEPRFSALFRAYLPLTSIVQSNCRKQFNLFKFIQLQDVRTRSWTGGIAVDREESR